MSCSVIGCENPIKGRGLCNKHHLRLLRHGDPLLVKKAGNGETCKLVCSVGDCERNCQAGNLCSVHYARKRRYGDPLIPPRKPGNGQATEAHKKATLARAQRNYYATPHGKLRRRYSVSKDRARRGLKTAGVPKEEFQKLWETKICVLCSRRLSDADKSLDHIIPLSRGGANNIANMQIVHLICNQRKSNRL